MHPQDPDDQGDERRAADRRERRDRDRDQAGLHQEPERVGAGGEVGGVPERDEAGEPDEQVQRHRQEAVGEEVDQEVAQGRLRKQHRQGEEQGEARNGDGDVAGEAGAQRTDPHEADAHVRRPPVRAGRSA